MQDNIKIVLAIVLALFITGIFFRFLIKIGFLVLLVLGIVYLFQKVQKK